MKNFALDIDISDVLSPGSEEYQRCQRLRNSLVEVESEICLERARIVTNTYKKNEGETPLTQRVKAFDAVLREMTIFIVDEELIVGHQSEKRRSAPLFPEFAVEWIDREIETFPTRGQDRFKVTADQIKEFREEILPYWKGRTFNDRMKTYLTEDINLLREDAALFSVGLHEDGGLGHVLLNYEKLLKQGLRGIRDTIHEKISYLTEWRAEDLKKREYYYACMNVIDSVIAFAHRYSAFAKDRAKEETNKKRKAELLRIAEVCENVPENPAKGFHEALQSIWFIQLVTQIYDNGVSMSVGRLDQFVYPFYENDIISGKLTKVQAQELLEAFWVKFTEPIKVYCAKDAAIHAGYPMGQNLTVGGILEDGTDGTNDLSYRCLEAHSHILLMQPNFTARLHNKSPREYVRRVCEAVRMGNGMPQLVNDEAFVPALMNAGIPLKEARNYGAIGCVEPTSLNAWGRCNGGYFNIAKVVELTIFNGRCSVSDKQVSVQSGDPRNFKTFDEFAEAYKKQMKYCISTLVKWDNIIDMVHEQLFPAPLTSLFVDDCIDLGKDVTSGGARYNFTEPTGVGTANAGDSLFAIKYLVFDEKKYSMDEIINALDADFAGYEYMREYMAKRVPKYGNDIDEADAMVKLATDTYFNAQEGFETYRGGPFVGGLVPVSSYVAFGSSTGALPDGRRKGTALADGISPNYGSDVEGPTAAMKSVAKIDHQRSPNGVIFNQKLSPLTVSSIEGMNKWIDLIMTYIKLGGAHIQYNVVSGDTLRAAKKDPDKYKSLVVRVAGYSAFFNELSEDVQDSIIARTEHVL